MEMLHSVYKVALVETVESNAIRQSNYMLSDSAQELITKLF